MDPQESLEAFLDAISDKDRTLTILYAHAIAGWIDRGGYFPEVKETDEGYFVERSR